MSILRFFNVITSLLNYFAFYFYFIIPNYHALTIFHNNLLIRHSPKIWLSGYTEPDSYTKKLPDQQFRFQNQFEDDFILKNGSEYVADSIFSIEFTCEADYPISWKIPFPKQIMNPMHQITHMDVNMKDLRVSELGPQIPHPMDSRFKRLLNIVTSGFSFLSINLTCSSVEMQPELQSSIYVYYNNGRQTIENQGSTLQVYLEAAPPSKLGKMLSNLPPLKLPCRPASPDMKVTVEKETSETPLVVEISTEKSTWLPLSPTLKDLTFDPKVGFTLQRKLLGNRVFGLYRCLVVYENSADNNVPSQQADNDQYVYINVTKRTSNSPVSEENEPETKFQPRTIIRGQASVEYVQVRRNMEYMQCCSGIKDKPPIMKSVGCYDAFGCQMLRESIAQDKYNLLFETPVMYEENVNASSDCRRIFVHAPSFIITCHGDNLDYAEHFVNIFHPLAGGPVTNRSKGILLDKGQDQSKTSQSTSVSLTRYESWENAQNVPETQKMIILIGRDRQNVQQNDLDGHGVVFRYSEPSYDYGYEFEDDFEMERRLRRMTAHVTEYNRDEYYEGEVLVFMCFGVRFFYEEGPHMRLNWGNGQTTVLDPPPRSLASIILSLVDKATMVKGNGGLLYSMFAKPVIAKKGMTQVDCWMPVRNSSRWDKVSKNVTIVPSVRPKFKEAEKEILYFYVGDPGKIIRCTVIQGLPLPNVAIYKDGKPMKIRLMETANNMSTGGPKWQNGTNPTEMVNKNWITIRVRFTPIQHIHQGSIRCVAKNVNGTVTRTVRIYVIEKPGMALPISLSIVAILSLVILGLAIKHCRDKRIVMSLRASNVHININF